MTKTLAVLVLALSASAASAQTAPADTPDAGTATLCGQPVPPPAQLPPAESGPLVYVMGLCFSAQNNQSAVEAQTYLYYLQLRPSQPSHRARPTHWTGPPTGNEHEGIAARG